MAFHRGATVDEATKKVFEEAEKNEGCLFVKFSISNDTFKKEGEGKLDSPGATPQEEHFAAVSGSISESACSLHVMRFGTKWLVVLFAPSSAPLSQRSMYSLSTGTLKAGLGCDKFVNDFCVVSKDACTLSAYTHTRKKQGPDMFTAQEVRAAQATMDTATMSQSPVTLAGACKIEVPPTFVTAIEDFKENKTNTVAFTLAGSQLAVKQSSNTKVEDLAKQLQEEPLYVLLRFAHEREKATCHKDLLLLYCPEKATALGKGALAACKGQVLAALLSLGLSLPHSIVAVEAEEIGVEHLLDSLYPKNPIKKTWRKPSRQGRGKARLHHKKFVAPPSS
mmetsp:Transcript_15842/g.31008  ORF Transcript_15842/g.31008 Transcript_15842/m.31008 type:complete len:336 (-) Transcript_15842:139-1146(-)